MRDIFIFIYAFCDASASDEMAMMRVNFAVYAIARDTFRYYFSLRYAV